MLQVILITECLFSLAGDVTVAAGRVVEQRTGWSRVRATIGVGTVDALLIVPACHLDTRKTRADHDNCRTASVDHLASRVGARAQHDRSLANSAPKRERVAFVATRCPSQYNANKSVSQFAASVADRLRRAHERFRTIGRRMKTGSR